MVGVDGWFVGDDWAENAELVRIEFLEFEEENCVRRWKMLVAVEVAGGCLGRRCSETVWKKIRSEQRGTCGSEQRLFNRRSCWHTKGLFLIKHLAMMHTADTIILRNGKCKSKWLEVPKLKIAERWKFAHSQSQLDDLFVNFFSKTILYNFWLIAEVY